MDGNSLTGTFAGDGRVEVAAQLGRFVPDRRDLSDHGFGLLTSHFQRNSPLYLMFCAQQPRLKSGLRFAPEWRNPSNPTSLGGLPAALPASVIADPKAREARSGRYPLSEFADLQFLF
jgi:hypothetical protein